MQFLFSFFRVLIEGNDQRYRLDFKEERRLWDAIERDLHAGSQDNAHSRTSRTSSAS